MLTSPFLGLHWVYFQMKTIQCFHILFPFHLDIVLLILTWFSFVIRDSLPLHGFLPSTALFLPHIHPHLTLSLFPCRSARAGLCDVGLPSAVLPQHHLRGHRECHHLRVGCRVAGLGASSSEEEECSASHWCKGSLPPPTTVAAVPLGHLRSRPHASRWTGFLSWLPLCSRPI